MLYGDSILFRSADKHQLRLKWEFEINNVPSKITVTHSWKARNWIFEEHFPMNAIHPSGGISLWEDKSPLFSDWLKVGDSVLIKNNRSGTTYAYYYKHQFEPSRPPMALKPGLGSDLTIDSIFTLVPGQHYAPSAAGSLFFPIGQ